MKKMLPQDRAVKQQAASAIVVPFPAARIVRNKEAKRLTSTTWRWVGKNEPECTGAARWDRTVMLAACLADLKHVMRGYAEREA